MACIGGMMAKKLIEVEWFKSNKHLSEIYQQTGMMFAFVSSPKEGYKMCHEWVKCRDFLHDAVRAQILKSSCLIYGFNFEEGKNPPIDLKKMRMLVSRVDLKVGDKDNISLFKQKMKSSLELLHHYEKMAGVSLSRIKEVNPEKSGKAVVFLFVSPVMWMTSPFLVSMYTFIIRLGDKQLSFSDNDDLMKQYKEMNESNKKSSSQDNDKLYLGDTGPLMHKIICSREKLFMREKGFHNIYFKNLDISSFHNYSGIRSLSSEITKDKDLNSQIRALKKEN